MMPATTALASARPAAMSMATRKPVTKASSIALSTAAAVPPSSPSGTSAPARSTFSASSCWRAPCGRSSSAVRASSWAENIMNTKMPSTGMQRRLAVRETALLTPEARPAWLPETELMAVVVSGAMTSAIPKPITTIAGKIVVQYEPRRGYRRADHKRQLRPVTGHQPASPPRHHEGDHDERQERAAGCRRRVAVDLYEVERQVVQRPTQSRIQEQRQQVRPREVARTEEREGHHRL